MSKYVYKYNSEKAVRVNVSVEMYCRLKESCIFDDAAFKRKLRNVEMIKIRLMGKEEIKIIIENISHINDVRILSCQISMPIEEASDYGRIYMKWRKRCCVMLYGKEGIGMKGKMLKEVQFVMTNMKNFSWIIL